MLKKCGNRYLTLLVHSKIAVFEWGKILIDLFNTQAVKNKYCLHTVYHVKDIRRYDAPIIIVGVDSVWIKEVLDNLSDAKHMIILINGVAYKYDEYISHISVDQRVAAKKCIDLLRENGRTAPAFFGVQENDTSDQIKALTFSGLYSSDDVYRVCGNVGECCDRLLKNIDRYDSIICANDVMAIYLLARCRRIGIEIPKRLHLIGNGNLWLSSHVTPSITSVSCDDDAFVKVVLQMCNNLCELKSFGPVNIGIGAKIIQRESTGAPYDQDDAPIHSHGPYLLPDNEMLSDELLPIVTIDRVLSSYTREKREILRYFAMGISVAEISERVFLSEDTVNYHIKKLYKLLNIHSKKEFLEIVDAYGLKL